MRFSMKIEFGTHLISSTIELSRVQVSERSRASLWSYSAVCDHITSPIIEKYALRVLLCTQRLCYQNYCVTCTSVACTPPQPYSIRWVTNFVDPHGTIRAGQKSSFKASQREPQPTKPLEDPPNELLFVNVCRSHYRRIYFLSGAWPTYQDDSAPTESTQISTRVRDPSAPGPGSWTESKIKALVKFILFHERMISGPVIRGLHSGAFIQIRCKTLHLRSGRYSIALKML